MKKIVTILLSIMVAASIMLTGCGKEKIDPVEDIDNSSAATAKKDKDEDETEKKDQDKDKKKDDVENNPVVENMVEQIEEQLAPMKEALGDSATLEMSARGNSIVCAFNYNIDVSKEAIEGSMSAVDPTMESMARLMQAQGVEDASVIIECFGPDGEEIFTKEYK